MAVLKVQITDATAIAISEFGGCALGNRARARRAVRFGEDLLRQPDASIPTICGDSHQAKAAYRFLGSRYVNHDALLSGHIDATFRRCAEQDVVLFVQDSTYGDYSHHPATKGLGLIGNGDGRGLCTHSTLAVTWRGIEDFDVLGVVDQQVWTRKGRKGKRSSAARKRDPNRESLCWIRAVERIEGHRQRLAPEGAKRLAPQLRALHVGDIESDIFELFEACDAMGDSFVLRAGRDRRIEPLETGEKLFERVGSAPVLTTTEVDVPARPGRPARLARVQIRATSMEVCPPRNRPGKTPAQPLNIVWVQEIEAPADVEEPLCWYLLTREPIDTEEAVFCIINIYKIRWVIEDFHMGLKTGCALERRQLETGHGLRNFLAFASVTAWHLLRLRQAARAKEPVPIEQVLSPTQTQALRSLRPKLPPRCTAQQALIAIATLGGFMGRKSDGMPGWRTLWRGMEKVLFAEQVLLKTLLHDSISPVASLTLLQNRSG